MTMPSEEQIKVITLFLQTIALLIAAVSFLVGAVFSWLRYRHDSLSRNVAASLSLIREWRSSEMRAAKEFVRTGLSKYDSSLGYSGLPDDVKDKVVGVSYLCDEIATRVIYGEADKTVIYVFIGDSMSRLWSSLEPYIITERNKIGGFSAYQKHFEALVTVGKTKKSDIAKLRERNIATFTKKGI